MTLPQAHPQNDTPTMQLGHASGSAAAEATFEKADAFPVLVSGVQFSL